MEYTGTRKKGEKALRVHERRYFVLLVMAISTLCLPVLLVESPPLVDLPNHVARVFIVKNLENSSFFAHHFQLVSQPIPNVMFDLITVPLMSVFGPWESTRIFLVAAILLFGLGCHLVGNGDNEFVSMSPIVASTLVLSGTFFYGYVNYVMSVSLFLVTFGLWLRWRHRRSIPRLLLLVLFAYLVYLSHLSCIAFLALAVFIYRVFDFLRCPSGRRRLVNVAHDAAIFILPTISFLWFVSGSGSLGLVEWSGAIKKIILFFSPFRSYDLIADVGFICFILMFFVVARLGGSLNISKGLGIVALVFFLIFIPAPSQLFTAGDADARIVLPGVALLLLSIRANARCNKVFLVSILFVTFIVFRTGLVASHWNEMSQLMSSEAENLKVIPPQSLVYPMIGPIADVPREKHERPLIHVLGFATLQNGSIFPTLFAIKGQHPLIFRDPLQYASYSNADPDKWKYLIDEYDYVWTYDVPEEVTLELSERMTMVFVRDKTRIWELNK